MQKKFKIPNLCRNRHQYVFVDIRFKIRLIKPSLMKIIFSLILMSISLPSFAEMSNNEKTAWTGGYVYGFIATLCEGKRLGYINESEFILIINTLFKNKSI